MKVLMKCSFQIQPFLCFLFSSFFFLPAAFSSPSPTTDYFQDLENFQQKNLSLHVQKGKLSAANDDFFSKKLFWTPDISVSLGKTKTELNHNSVEEYDYAQASAFLNLFRGGVDWARLDQAEALQNAQSLALKNETLRTDITASDLIFKALYLKESLRIQEELFKMKEDSFKIVKDRYTQGKIPQQEVSKSEVDLAQQKNKVRLSALNLAENEFAIRAQFVEALQSQDWPFSERETFIFANQPQGSKNKQKLPSVEQKYWVARAGEFSWKAAQRAYWPSLDLAFQYKEFPLKERDNQQWTSMIELKIPLWSKYETASSVSSAFAGYLEANAEFESTERAALIKDEFLKKKIEIVRQNLGDAKANLEKSKNLYRDLLKSFRLGRLSTNDLLLEQNRLLESASSLADSQLSFHQTVVEACALQGFRVPACLK